MIKKVLRKALAIFATAVITFGGSSLPALAAPVQMEDGTMFDAEYYAATNPDVVAAVGTSAAALWAHYKAFGRNEGRLPYAGAPRPGGPSNPTAGGTANLGALLGKTGCILVNANTVGLSLALPTAPASDDGILYIVAMGPFESVPSTAAIAQIPMAVNPQATFALPANTGLYCKYAFAVKQGGALKLLGTPQYITNPELLATATRPFTKLPVKSLQDQRTTFWNYIIDLPAGQNGGAANTQMLQVLNKGTDPNLIHPYAGARETKPIADLAGYYMINCANWAGVTTFATKLHNIATITRTQDFIIGNEVNERKWNYVAYVDWDTYVKEYYQGLRVAYNAVKSANANARVFTSIDQRWDCNYPTSNPEYYHFIDGKDFLTKLNNLVVAEGNIDWSVAAHPHFVPLTWSRCWNYAGLAGGNIYQGLVQSGKFMDVTNASMLTNFLATPAMLSPTGQVRTVVYSEITVATAPDEASQAAALYLTFYATATNPYVEAIIYAQDASTNAYFLPKTTQIYNMMGTDQNAQAQAYAETVIGRSVTTVIH
jgi:hypothetical protein